LRQLTFGKDSAASFGNIKNNEKKDEGKRILNDNFPQFFDSPASTSSKNSTQFHHNHQQAHNNSSIMGGGHLFHHQRVFKFK